MDRTTLNLSAHACSERLSTGNLIATPALATSSFNAREIRHAKVKDTRRQCRIGLARNKHLRKMRRVARAPTGNHRNLHGLTHRPASTRNRTPRASHRYPSKSTKSHQPRAARPHAPTPPHAAPSPFVHRSHTLPHRLRHRRRAERQSPPPPPAPQSSPQSPRSTPAAQSRLELIDTLSAPAVNTASASSALRMPPPTVNGINSVLRGLRFTVSRQRPAPLMRRT